MKRSLLVLVGFVFVFSACAKRPGLDSAKFASASFAHTGVTGNCAQCHEKDRPAPVAGVRHGSGGDCVACHTYGAGWKRTTSYSHQPVPTSCTTCHEALRPPTSTHPSINDPAVIDKSHFAQKDCVSCHGTPPQKAAFDFDHLSAQRSTVGFCLPCHYTQGNTKHGAAIKPQYFAGDGQCQTCHGVGPTLADWRNRAVAPHTPLPVSCNSCHASDRPSTTTYPDGQGVQPHHFPVKDCASCHIPNTVAFTFAHKLSTGSGINFCLPCHDAVGRKKHWATHPEYFSGNNGDGTCYNCHNRGRSWSN